MLVGGAACIYAPSGEDLDTQVATPGAAFDTTRGFYSLVIDEVDVQPWPSHPGPGQFAVRVGAGPGFVAEDADADDDDEPQTKTPQYPLTLTVESVDPPVSAAEAVKLVPDLTTLSPQGTGWLVKFTFAVPGDWTMEMRVTDAAGVTDGVRVVFPIDPPTHGRPVPTLAKGR